MSDIAYTTFSAPPMLIWARNETPFSSVEAVQASFPKISSKKLLDWEEGKDYPSITEAKRLASIYKVPFATFYLSTVPPKKIKKYTDRRTNNGMYISDISYSLWAEIQRIQSNRNTLLDLHDDLSNIKKIPIINYIDPDQIAIAIRKHLGLETPLQTKSAYGNNPFNYYRDILERNDIIVSQISGVSLSEMKGISIHSDIFPIVAVKVGFVLSDNSKNYIEKTITANDIRARIVSIPSSIINQFSERQTSVGVMRFKWLLKHLCF